MTKPKRPKRAGRPRKALASRQPDGRVSQRAPKEKAMDIVSVVKEARQRVFGVQPDDMPETSILGRLCASGEITYLQYRGLRRYGEVMRAFDQAILSRPVPSAGDLNRRGGHDGGEGDEPLYVMAYNRAVNEAEKAKKALRDCPDRLTTSVVNAVVLSDLDAAYFIGALREGANALVRLYHIRENDELLLVDKRMAETV